MKSLNIGAAVLAVLFAVPASPLLAQDPHADPRIIDFEVHCKTEIDAYARSKNFDANSPDYHHNVHFVFVLPDSRERLAAVQWSLRHIMSQRKPTAQEFLTLCTVNRNIAQIDGAPLATRRTNLTGATLKPADRVAKQGPMASAPVSTKAKHWDIGVREPPKAPAPVKKAAAKRRSKDKPVPHLSDDQKVLNEILRLQKSDYYEYRSRRLAHIKSQADRHDALIVATEDTNTGAAFRVINNTDISLVFTITYALAIDGKPQSVIPFSFVIGPNGNAVYPVGHQGKWLITNVYTRWQAHSSNFEGTWNTGLQGGPGN